MTANHRLLAALWTSALTLLVSACATTHAGTSLLPEEDDGRLRAVIGVLPALAATSPFTVSAYPLDSSSSIVGPGRADLATDATATASHRASLLKSLGIELVADARYPGCPSTQAFGLTPAQVTAARAACPIRKELRFAIGLPRIGGAYLPMGGVDHRKIGADSGYVVYRVVAALASPQGESDVAWDVVVADKRHHYAIVERRFLMIAE